MHNAHVIDFIADNMKFWRGEFNRESTYGRQRMANACKGFLQACERHFIYEVNHAKHYKPATHKKEAL